MENLNKTRGSAEFSLRINMEILRIAFSNIGVVCVGGAAVQGFYALKQGTIGGPIWDTLYYYSPLAIIGFTLIAATSINLRKKS